MDANWHQLREQGDAPGPRVGATLTVIEVELHTKHLRGAHLQEGVPLVEDENDKQNYGLYLFGGDDAKGNQTDELYIFYLQARAAAAPRSAPLPPADAALQSQRISAADDVRACAPATAGDALEARRVHGQDPEQALAPHRQRVA